MTDMLRWSSLTLVVLLLALAGWALLQGGRRSEVAAPPSSTVPVDAAQAEASPGLGERQGVEAIEVPHVTAAEVEAEAVPAPLTGVLAGRLLLEGGPLREATLLTLLPDGRLRDRPQGSGTIETDALGRFRREGLPADWSGQLRLAAPYRLAGNTEQRRILVLVEAPSEALEIDVARDPCLRGRLTHAHPELAGETNLDVTLYSPGGGYSQHSRKSNAAGRFFVVLADPEFPKVRVEASARDGATCSVLRERESLAFDPVTGDYDLGELPLHGGFQAHLRVLGPDRGPVEGAQIHLRGASLPVPATDSAGETRFSVPDTATGMRVVARGYAFESFPPPAGSERTDLVLRRTNRLRVVVLDEQGEPWVGGLVKLRAEGELYASSERSLPPALVHGRQSFDVRGNVDARGLYHLLLTADDGAIEVQDLTPGVAIEVQVCDELERPWIAERLEGLGREEAREVALRLPSAGARVRGRCTGPAGAPVTNARVWIEWEGTSTSVGCAADGRFESPVLAPGEVWVRATAPGHTLTDRLHVDAARAEVNLTLEPGRVVRVGLRDRLGREVRVGQLELRVPGTDRVWSGGRAVGAEREFRDVARDPLELGFEWFSRSTTARIDAGAERVELVVEALGSLAIAISRRVPEPEEWLQLRLTALDGPAPGAEITTHPPTVDRPRQLELWPGRYEVQLFEFRRDAQMRVLPSTPYMHPVHVEVTAGATTELTLGDD